MATKSDTLLVWPSIRSAIRPRDVVSWKLDDRPETAVKVGDGGEARGPDPGAGGAPRGELAEGATGPAERPGRRRA